MIIVDDIGMLTVGEDAAEGFYRLVDACYEKHSLAVSSNLHPAGFDEIIPKTLATATVDRLLHHAHTCVPTASATDSPSTAGRGCGSPQTRELGEIPRRRGENVAPPRKFRIAGKMAMSATTHSPLTGSARN